MKRILLKPLGQLLEMALFYNVLSRIISICMTLFLTRQLAGEELDIYVGLTAMFFLYYPIVDLSANTMGLKLLISSNGSQEMKRTIMLLRIIGFTSLMIYLIYTQSFNIHLGIAFLALLLCGDWIYKAIGENVLQTKKIFYSTTIVSIVIICLFKFISTENIFLLFRAIPLLFLFRFDYSWFGKLDKEKFSVSTKILTSTIAGFLSRWYIHWPVGFLISNKLFNSELSEIYLIMGYLINAKGLLLSSYLPDILQAEARKIKKSSLKLMLTLVPLGFLIMSANFLFFRSNWILLLSWFFIMLGFGLESTYSIAIRKPAYMLWSSGLVCSVSLWLWMFYRLQVSDLLLYFVLSEVVLGSILFTLNRLDGYCNQVFS